MRVLLPVIGIVVVSAIGIGLETHFPSKHVALADATLGVPVYELHANKQDMKTLPEQEIPLP